MQNNRLQNDERRDSKTLKTLTQFIFWNSKNLNVLEKSKPSNLHFFCNTVFTNKLMQEINFSETRTPEKLSTNVKWRHLQMISGNPISLEKEQFL